MPCRSTGAPSPHTLASTRLAFRTPRRRLVLARFPVEGERAGKEARPARAVRAAWPVRPAPAVPAVRPARQGEAAPAAEVAAARGMAARTPETERSLTVETSAPAD